ncbi:hypothetical protein ACIQZB_15660 [Streptomyces sp. NPDC097727]|uniref:hypothetical protein n=1 Tax=Streptomyces sp. NPDC097727 TaxID=3366092 RepID=UPI0038136679
MAEVSWPSTCAPAADTLTATCDFGSLDGAPYISVAEIGLRAAAGAPADAAGTLHFTATADSSFGPLTGYPTDTRIRLGDGPDLGVNQLPYRTGVKPGTCYATGTNRYTCRTPILLWEKARSTFDFTLRVDRLVEGGAKGSVATLNDDPELRISAFDPRLANNTAEFTVSGT